LLDSKAVTRIQAVALAVVIVVASLSGVATYYIFSQTATSDETIKIGVFADIDGLGRFPWQAVLLAAEQVNAEGGILGRQVEVIGEDTGDQSNPDPMTLRSALTRLLTYHEVDFIIGDFNPIVVDTMAENKKIFVTYIVNDVEELVLEDYDKYKYLFSLVGNAKQNYIFLIDSLQTLSENTDFKKVAYLFGTGERPKKIMDNLDATLPELGYEIVYRGAYSPDTIDFSSYFAQAEAAGAEILIPWIGGFEGVSVVKEYFDRQSPMIIYSGLLGAASTLNAWEFTEGKCEHLCVLSDAFCVGYPFTSKTLPAREAYVERWGAAPGIGQASAYDMIRFILPDAIERAGTVETDAVVEALEQTNLETASTRNFAFSSSHGVMTGENPTDPEADYTSYIIFQWQNGTMVPVYPGWLMEEAEATLNFPHWPGPWD
jgi:branched-chain amino acid transport system substrate-binding protein